MFTIKLRCIAIFIFLTVGAGNLFSNASESFPKTALEREDVVATAESVTTNTYPNANEVVLDEHIVVKYQPDGSAKTRDDEYVKVLTEKGRRERKSMNLRFNEHYSEVVPELIEIIKPDGTVREVDLEQQSKTMTEPSQMGSNIYNPKEKVLKITLSGLEVGDIVHYRIQRNQFKARMADTWSDYTLFEYTTPIRRILYEVEAPADLPIEHKVVKDRVEDTVAYSRKEHSDHTRHSWEVRDVPRMYEEPRMPPLSTVVQRLLVSTIPDWETVSRWYWDLSKPRLDATTPKMEEKVEELIAGASGDMDKVRRIFRFVSQEIRYMGITTEETAPGYEPHDVSMTFENRYGVCRDKAALLVAMLRLAGLDAYPVLIYVGPKKDEEVPQPYFNHAIAAVELEPGEYTLMDPTDESTRDLLPNYLCNKSYLIAKPQGEDLQTSPIVPATENLLRVSSTGKLDSDNTLSVDTVIDFDGVNDSVYRGFFARQKQEDLRRFFEERVRKSVPGSTLESFEYTPEDLMNTEIPLSVSFSFSSEDYPTGESGTAMLPPPWVAKSLGVASFVLRGTGLSEREYPLATEIACGIDESFELDLSESDLEPISTPQETELETGKASFHQKYTGKKDKLTAQSRLLLEDVEFLPDEYLELKELLGKRETAKRRKPIYQSNAGYTGHPDVKIMSKEVEVDMETSRKWKTTTTERKKILTYAGKKDNSEVKINYNPVWESVSIEAQVTGPDGTVQTISDEELNVMDASWAASAPRYPAAKTLVASLPGVETGSVVETKIAIESTDKPFFSLNWHPGGFDPVEQSSLKLNLPSEIEKELSKTVELPALARKLETSTNTEQDRTIHTWRAESLPGLKKEEHLPPWWTFGQTVFLSNGEWQEYLSKVDAHLHKAAARSEKCDSLAEELIQDADSRNARIRAVRDYVAENINLAGPKFPGLPLRFITAADRTLDGGYGNTTDRAVVLYALLESAGFEPEFLLASSWASRLDSVRKPLIDHPARQLFDTVLVRLEDEDGDLYLNGSNQYAALGTTKFDGKPAVGMDGEIFTIHALSDRADKSTVEYRIDLEASGNAAIDFERIYHGTGYTDFHRKFAEMQAEEKRRYYQELISELSQNAEATSELATDYSEYPGRKAFSADIENFAVRDAERLYFALPRHFTSVIAADTENRFKPYYRRNRSTAEADYRITLPPNVEKVNILPIDIDWEGPAGIGTIGCSSRIERNDEGRQVLIIERDVDLEPAIVPPSQYEELLKIGNKMTKPESWTVMVELGDTDKGDSKE